MRRLLPLPLLPLCPHLPPLSLAFSHLPGSQICVRSLSGGGEETTLLSVCVWAGLPRPQRSRRARLRSATHMKRSSDSRRTRTSRRRRIRAISTSISSGAMLLSAMHTSPWPAGRRAVAMETAEAKVASGSPHPHTHTHTCV